VSQFRERSGIFSPSASTFKVTNLAEHNHGSNAEPLVDEGTTRDLGFVVPSRRAGTYLNFQFCSPIFFVC